ncbi:MAG: alpha/beta hydrolase [Lachnospiraceae bacterium]|nr:alpha/beta hydrolase [Lachnospiraceae bacterium]
MWVHEFCEGNKPVMVLIHGVLTPWQIWMPQINAFKAKYNIYTIALNAHTEEEASEFISLEAEAAEITQALQTRNVQAIDVLCGLSLGGVIAHEIWKEAKLPIHHLVLDGAPLVPFPLFSGKVMTANYLSIIHKSKARDPKVLESFKKQFLPEKYLDSYLKIADFMTDTSITNIIQAADTGNLCTTVNNHSKILFLHGTKGNEILSKKVVKLMKKAYPETQVICFKGDVHCYKAIYEPEKWIEVVDAFLT